LTSVLHHAAERADPVALAVDELPVAIRLELLADPFELLEGVGRGIPPPSPGRPELVLGEDAFHRDLPAPCEQGAERVGRADETSRRSPAAKAWAVSRISRAKAGVIPASAVTSTP
jgi:hypothetical protein